MIRRAKTFDSVLGIIIPLERTYTRPPRTAVSRTVPSFKMNGATSLMSFRRGNCRRVAWARRPHFMGAASSPISWTARTAYWPRPKHHICSRLPKTTMPARLPTMTRCAKLPRLVIRHRGRTVDPSGAVTSGALSSARVSGESCMSPIRSQEGRRAAGAVTSRSASYPSTLGPGARVRTPPCLMAAGPH